MSDGISSSELGISPKEIELPFKEFSFEKVVDNFLVKNGKTLPPQLKSVLVLDFAGFTPIQTAEVIGTRPNYVSKDLLECRKILEIPGANLRKTLWQETGYTEYFFKGLVDRLSDEYPKLEKNPELRSVLAYYLAGYEGEEIAQIEMKAMQTVRIQLNQMRQLFNLPFKGNLRVFALGKWGVDYAALKEKYSSSTNL